MLMNRLIYILEEKKQEVTTKTHLFNLNKVNIDTNLIVNETCLESESHFNNNHIKREKIRTVS